MPDHVVLARGEEPRALIHPDWQVHALMEGLLAIGVLILISLLILALDLSQGRAPQGLRGGLLTTLAFLAGPVLVQRMFGRQPPYVLTSKRLVLTGDIETHLQDIRRIRVWMTSVTLHTDAHQIRLKSLINPPAVARLIRDTIAAQGKPT